MAVKWEDLKARRRARMSPEERERSDANVERIKGEMLEAEAEYAAKRAEVSRYLMRVAGYAKFENNDFDGKSFGDMADEVIDLVTKPEEE